LAPHERPRPARVDALQPTAEPGTIVVSVSGCIAPVDIPKLCLAARALLERSEAGTVVWDVGGLEDPDGAALDALARLQLIACRQGHRGRLRHAHAGLLELLSLSGLSDVLPPERA
jgi:ABC-type transporter Mla MlaB component